MPTKKRSNRIICRWIIFVTVAIGILVIGVLSGFVLSNLVINKPQSRIFPTPTQRLTITPKITLTITPTPTEVLDLGSTRVRDKDGMVMVYIPPGSFTMGVPVIPPDSTKHEIYLDAYWIDQTEVTNGMYKKCIQDGFCKPPSMTSSINRSQYYSDKQYNNFPVVNVDWEKAHQYCKWVNGHLPSEAEWEKAYRGTDGRLFPWGDESPSCELANINIANFRICAGDLQEVGKYRKILSPYGVLDMAGNALEWVNDWYNYDYFRLSPFSNPQGPISGENKVIRGYIFVDKYMQIRYQRSNENPYKSFRDVGFRCAISIP